MTRPALALAVATLTVLAIAGCAEPAPAGGGDSEQPTATPTLSGSITVDAAASLNRVFPELAESFQEEHPGTEIEFSFGGSSTLAAQIVAGAPVDVFAAASSTTMTTVQDEDLTAADPVAIARNQLEIAVPPGNPGGVEGLADFADEGKAIVVCDEEVPCGAAAVQVFDLAGVDAKPDSFEPDVASVLTRVREDNADAGLVYVTDVVAAGDDVEGIEFDESDDAVTDVLVAPLTGSSNPELAAAWVDHVVENGATVLTDAGFLPPQ